MTKPAQPLDRVVRGLSRRAVLAVRAVGPVTAPLPVVVPDDNAYTRQILDLALRIAEALLASGASANDATEAALRICHSYGLRGVHVDVTFTSITVSVHGGPTREPVSLMRVVRVRTIDYTRVQRMHQLIRDASAGMPVPEARAAFDDLMVAPPPYRKWVVTAGNALLVGGVCLLYAAHPIVAATAMVAGVLIDLLQRVLYRKQLPAFFVQAAGAAVPTVVAGLLWAGIMAGVPWLENVRPSLVVASGIVLLLSGLSIVGAAQDAIDGFYVTASARSFEVMMMTLGIVVGVIAMLQVLDRAGVELVISSTAPTLGPVALQLVGAIMVTAAFAVTTMAGPRTVLVCTAIGLLGYCSYLLMTALGLGPVGASAVGTTLAGYVATVLARKLAVPALALTTSAVVPLMPGSLVFRGILQLVSPDGGETALAQGFVSLMTAASIGVALAAGVSLGTYLGRARPSRRAVQPREEA